MSPNRLFLRYCNQQGKEVILCANMDCERYWDGCVLSPACFPCLSLDVTTPEDHGIELRMTNINDAQCALTVKDGKAAARVEVGGKRGAEKCKIVLKIQVKQGTSWVTVDSWTVEKDGRNASIEESVKTESGKTYRAQATVTVWIDGESESKTITTTGKKA